MATPEPEPPQTDQELENSIRLWCLGLLINPACLDNNPRAADGIRRRDHLQIFEEIKRKGRSLQDDRPIAVDLTHPAVYLEFTMLVQGEPRDLIGLCGLLEQDNAK